MYDAIHRELTTTIKWNMQHQSIFNPFLNQVITIVKIHSTENYKIKKTGMKAFLVGTVLSCRQFTPENTYPSLPLPKVKLNWPKIEKCFGHDVTTPIKESIGAFIVGTGANCASICEFRANDECTSCYHYCEECLEESMLKISDGNINSVHHAFCAIGL